MSILSSFRVIPPNSAGPLLSELSPSTIAEVNAVVNGMQHAKTKKTEPYVKYRCVHLMVSPTTSSHAVGEKKSSEISVLIRKFYPAKNSCYTVLDVSVRCAND